MANDTNRRSYTYDSALLLKDAGLVAASAAATVGGSAAAAILDVGATSFLMGVVVMDVTAIEIDSANEHYQITLQGSASATFASGIEDLASLSLGSTAVRLGGAQDSTIGRYELLFQNVNNDTQYRYLRLYITVAGTVATGINFKAFISTQLDM